MLRHITRSIFIFLIINFAFLYEAAGQISIDTIANLPAVIHETSGLIFLNKKLITHNDSGNESSLYEVDTVSGTISRKVILNNATNIDWEDICADNIYIYIGDFGNNGGNRTDLRVYRILISEFFENANDTVEAETINYSYSDQSDFTPGENSSNFDAEALISFGDSLYIFTKNWLDFKTNVYALSKMPGTYSISKVDSINSQGLVTGACYNPLSGSIFLTGYELTSAFVIELSQFAGNKFGSGNISKTKLQLMAQMEAIIYKNKSAYFLTCEQSFLSNSMLFSLSMDGGVGIANNNFSPINVYPNPSSEFIIIDFEQVVNVECYNTAGVLVFSKQAKHINISQLGKGVYTLHIKTLGGDLIDSRKIIVN